MDIAYNMITPGASRDKGVKLGSVTAASFPTTFLGKRTHNCCNGCLWILNIKWAQTAGIRDRQKSKTKRLSTSSCRCGLAGSMAPSLFRHHLSWTALHDDWELRCDNRWWSFSWGHKEFFFVRRV